MKKMKILALLLSLVMLVGIASYAFAIEAYADDQTNSGSGMEISKTATANADGTFNITLEAYATGSKVISTTNKEVPTDIVLVLDQSGSMDYCIVCGEEMSGSNNTHDTRTATTQINTNGSTRYYIKTGSTYTRVYYCSGTHRNDNICSGGAGWYTSERRDNHTADRKITPKTEANPDGTQFYVASGSEACTSRLTSIKNAVTTFANNVTAKAKGDDGQYGTADDVNHRIAVVGFATGDYTTDNSDYPRYQNTELFVGSTQYNYNVNASSYYTSALQDMNTQAGYNNVIASKNALDAKGATYPNYGLEMAKGILDANPVQQGQTRNRVVILFTDGAPGWNGYDSNVASATVSKAEALKNAGVTVYSVGIFGGADATSAGIASGNDSRQENQFMQDVSSNNGTPQNPSYYLSAGDAASLTSIFQQISENIESGGSATTLTSETVIKDIIAPQFQLPVGTTGTNITLETYACTGKNGDTYTWLKNSGNMGATASVSGDQVNVTGFDFAENYVGTVTENGVVSYRGHKLVITFTIETRSGFLGGNDVYTNTSAGVYEDANATTPVLTFERPQVNVVIEDVTVTAADKNVYLLSGLTAEQIKEGATVKCGNVALDLSKADQNYGLENWQTEYVNISVEIKDENRNNVTDLTNLSDDTTYTVSAKISPKTVTPVSTQGTVATEQTGEADGAINVFKPELTYKDSTVYYGNDVPAEYTDNLVSTKWKHGTDEDSTVEMIGEKPTLEMTYTPDPSKIDNGKVAGQDIAVDVVVKIGTTEVTEDTTFIHETCDTNCTDPVVGGEFWLHVKNSQLTIIKSGADDVDEDQVFLFTITGPNDLSMQVVINGNRSVTIKNLPIGEYTITENQDWAWRYSLTGITAAKDAEATVTGSAITVDLTAEGETVSFTNTRSQDYWLGGDSFVENVFGAAAAAAQVAE